MLNIKKILLGILLSLPFSLQAREYSEVVTDIYDDYVAGSVVLGIFTPWPIAGFADIPYRSAVVAYHDEVMNNPELVKQVKEISPTMYNFLEERIVSGYYRSHYKK